MAVNAGIAKKTGKNITEATLVSNRQNIEARCAMGGAQLTQTDPVVRQVREPISGKPQAISRSSKNGNCRLDPLLKTLRAWQDKTRAE